MVARQHGLESAHLRLFSVYGPGEDPRRLVPSVVANLLAGRPVALTPGEQVRDFVYVDDVAAALVDAALRPGIDGLTVNVGTGVQTSVRDLCLKVAALTGGRRAAALRRRPYGRTSASRGAPRPSAPPPSSAGARARRSTRGCASPSPPNAT